MSRRGERWEGLRGRRKRTAVERRRGEDARGGAAARRRVREEEEAGERPGLQIPCRKIERFGRITAHPLWEGCLHIYIGPCTSAARTIR